MEAILNREIILSRALCRLFCVLTFIILTAIGAFVRIPLPFTPVPVTLQTFFVLLSGALLGGNLGGYAQLIYIIMGAGGIPIFSAAGSGMPYLLGPTGGYLIGFVITALLVGKIIKYSRDNLLRAFIIFCIGDLVLLSCGIIWLKLIFGYSFAKLLFIGLIPFIPGDLVKAFVAAVVYLKLRVRVDECM
jgi:biotin transport system substrate-specific component